MENQKNQIRGKLDDYFTEIFEKTLIDEIVDVGIFKTFKKGELLVDIGDEMTHIPLILDGAVKIIRENKNKDEILLYYLERGETCSISFVNCINQSKSMFRGVVENYTECIFIPINRIENWLIKYKTWREFIIDSYHDRLIEMVEAIRSLAFTNLDERINKYLIEQVKIKQNKNLNITHQEIADDLNSSRVVISRLLKKLEIDKKIKLGRNKLKVIKL